jgi:methylaspartate mutase epsilon subunit
MPARDARGYLRIFDAGALPLPRDVLEVHRDGLRERAAREGVPCDRELAIRSVYELSEPLAMLAPDRPMPAAAAR